MRTRLRQLPESDLLWPFEWPGLEAMQSIGIQCSLVSQCPVSRSAQDISSTLTSNLLSSGIQILQTNLDCSPKPSQTPPQRCPFVMDIPANPAASLCRPENVLLPVHSLTWRLAARRRHGGRRFGPRNAFLNAACRWNWSSKFPARQETRFVPSYGDFTVPWNMKKVSFASSLHELGLMH
jgi:hypothetical protein